MGKDQEEAGNQISISVAVGFFTVRVYTTANEAETEIEMTTELIVYYIQ